MSSTWRYSRPLAPSMVSDTAIVMIIAMVMVTLRHSPTSTSDRTYFTRIGDFLRVSGMRSFVVRASADRGRRAPGSAVDAAGLVTDDPAALDLDDAAAHLVHDVGVVGDHHDRRAGAVDPVQQAHDLDRGVRVEVSGGLVGQQDQRPVHERPGDGDPLLLTTGELVRVAVLLAAEPDQLQHLGHDPAGDRLGLADHLEGERHVLVRGAVGQQPEVLEDAADRAPEVGDPSRSASR